MRQFHEAVAANPAGRLEEVKDLVEEIEKRAEAMCIQERLYREGQLKKRTNHCDTKVNNMMFDADSDKVLCVIDLDTVMPGFVLSDIGDFIRTGANTGAEDDENLDNVNVNMEIFKAYTRGYNGKGQGVLNSYRDQIATLRWTLIDLYADRSFLNRLYQRRYLLQDP